MRALTLLMLCALAVLTGGWTRAASPALPLCTFNDHWGHKTLSVRKPGRAGLKLYIRFCGPAEAVVYVRGAPVRIHGGFCRRDEGLRSISVGLLAFPPAAPRKGVAFQIDPPTTSPGTFGLEQTAQPFVLSQIQADGLAVGSLGRGPMAEAIRIESGTLTVRSSMRSGTFAIFTSNHRRVTGSWTCG